jgi:hypothetical protein
MKAMLGLAGVILLWPGYALACPACISSIFGDRSYNWAFLGLILLPFLVSGIIAGILLYSAGYRFTLRGVLATPWARGFAGFSEAAAEAVSPRRSTDSQASAVAAGAQLAPHKETT